MDDFDYATAIEEQFRALAIATATRRPDGLRQSAAFCQNVACGVPIPEARRLAVPGCQFCIECQTRHETALKRGNTCR